MFYYKHDNKQTNNVNFNARYIDEATILKRSFFKYKPQKASIIEFDQTDPDDIWAIQKLVLLWGSNSVISGIENSGTTIGITTQMNDFIRPKAKKILGLLHYHENDVINFFDVSTLQVKPSTKHINIFNKIKSLNKFIQNFRKYKNVGKALIEHTKRTEMKKH